MTKKQNIHHRLRHFLDKRRQEDTFRSLKKEAALVDFCSNDYLGFATDGLLEDIPLATDLPSSGSTGSRLITGNFAFTEEVENKIAEFHQAETALLYNSGYSANVGFFSCLPRLGDTIFYDELIHASVHDGMKMSKAACISFSHNNIEDLSGKLAAAKGICFVAVESVYSMDGDFAPLKELAAVCQKFNANLVVDEAHATGVIGVKGAGLVQQLKLEDACFARVHTFGKAMGCHGAVVLGSALLRNYLVNFSRPFIYTTALPLHSIATIGQAYLLLEKHSERIVRLTKNIHYFKEQIKINKWFNALIPSDSPIQSILIPANKKIKDIAASIQGKGFDLRPILYPTVARGKERIRICLHAHNTQHEISELLELLNRY